MNNELTEEEAAWESYQITALVRYPTKALSKREFIAGYRAAKSALVETVIHRVHKIATEDDVSAWSHHQELVRKITEMED